MKYSAIFSIGLICFSANAFAQSCDQVHTWNSIETDQQGWQWSVTAINENPSFYVRAGSGCSKVQQRKKMLLSQNKTEFGYYYGKDASFDNAFSLLLLKKQHSAALMVSKSCLFIVTAHDYGKIDASLQAYNGAKCNYVDTGKGIIFQAS